MSDEKVLIRIPFQTLITLTSVANSSTKILNMDTRAQAFKGLILDKKKWGESDLMISFLHSNGAIESLIAKGALRSKKRFGGGVLEPTHYVNLMIQKTAQTDRLRYIQDGKVIEDFHFLRTDFDQLTLALVGMKRIKLVAKEGDENSEELFLLAGRFLRELTKKPKLVLIELQFLIKLLHQQGVLIPQDWMNPFLFYDFNQGQKEINMPLPLIIEKLDQMNFQWNEYHHNRF